MNSGVSLVLKTVKCWDIVTDDTPKPDPGANPEKLNENDIQAQAVIVTRLIRPG